MDFSHKYYLVTSTLFSVKWSEYHLPWELSHEDHCGELSKCSWMQFMTLPVSSFTSLPCVYLTRSANPCSNWFLHFKWRTSARTLVCKCDQEFAYCLAEQSTALSTSSIPISYIVGTTWVWLTSLTWNVFAQKSKLLTLINSPHSVLWRRHRNESICQSATSHLCCFSLLSRNLG